VLDRAHDKPIPGEGSMRGAIAADDINPAKCVRRSAESITTCVTFLGAPAVWYGCKIGEGRSSHCRIFRTSLWLRGSSWQPN
jgi:hypothetical protein